MPPMLAPTPTLELLASAAVHCGEAGLRLYQVLAEQYPTSLERRPGQLLRAAGATAADLDHLLAMAGFADTDELRLRAGRESSRRLAAPDLRFTSRAAEPGDRAALRRIAAEEQDNLARTLSALLSNGALELAAGAILGARRRWVLGDLKSSGYASTFAAVLRTTLRDVSLIQPAAGAAVNAIIDAHPSDVLIAYNFRRYSRITLEVAREFHELGATVIALTDSYSSPISAYATHVLAVDTRSESPSNSPTAVTATGHILAALAAAGAKGAGRRDRRRVELSDLLGCYADLDPEPTP
jgi:DNA-binding MurR/RpiR family transcriptional regulator